MLLSRTKWLTKNTALVLRVVVHIGAITPLLWLFFAIPQGRLGGDPIEELTHYLGLGALRLLLLTLCISPLAKMVRFGHLMKLRRPLGLWCFVWASLHFATWLALDLTFEWSLIGAELVKRTYILVGFAAWLLLAVLAITSIPYFLRAMGKYWKKLHKTIYFIALLACLHYWWALKSGWVEPLIYAVIALVLIGWRQRAWLGRLDSIRVAETPARPPQE